MNLDDTIVAIATPPGRGGIGVVRLAGSDSLRIAGTMLRFSGTPGLEPRQARFGELVDPATGARLDEIVAAYFPKPHSYTTDDIVEISCHGAHVLLRRVVELALEAGARLADPGEFTMRAFLNGRMDLTQAEAVRDLIDSQTLYQAQVAAQQLGGSISRQIQPVKQELVALIALLEAGVDFAEDDVSVLPAKQAVARIEKVRASLTTLRDTFAYGRVVHDGLTLAIIGRPNVGKSSLFNRLVERDRAIVTATPGTTRDLVTETVAIGGIPIHLVDTAGIREAMDEAESVGVRKSREAMADAGLILIVTDPGASVPEAHQEDADLLAAAQGRPAIVVANKMDLGDSFLPSIDGMPLVRTSALTGEGIPELRKKILHMAGAEAPREDSGFLTNLRHQKLVTDSLASLDAAERALNTSIPHEMVLMDLYGALRPLDELTGATTADDILNLIFSSFCIGK